LAKLEALPMWKGEIPRTARNALAKQMPEERLEMRISHRVGGVGSLGRQRFMGLATWRGGLIAREAKALAPSACAWAEGQKKTPGILYQEICIVPSVAVTRFCACAGTGSSGA
jgi:hypothetical protein